jgi:1,4-dihydroxy-2-naphthoate octaprenyltransferase
MTNTTNSTDAHSSTEQQQSVIPTWKAWLLATRPKTLTAAVVPVVVGTLLATTTAANTSIDWYLAITALMCALCIQIATNFINDSIDFKKGADSSTRIGPKRVTQSGLISEKNVLYAGFAMLVLAILFCIPLIIKGGLLLLITLLISVACAYLYTGGPKPLAYVGLGDLFVFIFFGIVTTVAVCYIQTGTFEPTAFLAGSQIGLLATVLIAINNLRDREEDAKVGKYTMAVRYGKLFSRCEITFLLIMPFILSIIWLKLHTVSAAMVPWLSYPLALIIVKDIWTTEPGPIYNTYLAKSAVLHLVFGALLAIGVLL